MGESEATQRQQSGSIRDARGRKVTQLDPVAMHLMRQHGGIEPDVLRTIANEPGVRISSWERATLIFAAVLPCIVVGLFTHSLIVGDFASGPWARSSSLVFFCLPPWLVWTRLKYGRFDKVAAAMLKHKRCPHCGYDLRLLPADPADGATICPECGCAWRV